MTGLSEPASDGAFAALFRFGPEQFRHFPSPTAMSELAAVGIVVRSWDAIRLGMAMRGIQSLPGLYFSREEVERESEIARLATDLCALLSHGSGETDGWRTFWGSADWSDIERTMEAPEPDGVVNIPEMMGNLDVLANAANERRRWLESARNFDFEPGNRADRTRYFYWLVLLAFWKYQLRRDIGTSTSEDRDDAYGPLIRMIKVMSAGDARATGNAIRGFIRRTVDRVEHFEEFFDPECPVDSDEESHSNGHFVEMPND